MQRAETRRGIVDSIDELCLIGPKKPTTIITAEVVDVDDLSLSRGKLIYACEK
jgi:hypothetical protein